MTRPVIALAALALVATACGGSTESTDTTGATSPSSSTTAPATSTTAASGDTFDWFAGIETGTCFDDVWDGDVFDFESTRADVPCDQPHDNEVVKVVENPDGDYPGEEALFAAATAACTPEYQAFFGTADRFTDFMFTWEVVPAADDWAAGRRATVCITYADEPVRGTARSAGLTAAGEILGVLHEVDGQLDVWILDGADGRLLLNVSDDPSSVQTSPPGWTLGGSAILWAQGDSEPSRRIWGAGAGDEPIPFLGGLDVDSVGSAAPNPVDLLQIAVIAAPDGGEFDVFLYDVEADVLTNLTADNSDRDTTPNWSPDGTKIAYRARHDGNSDVWVMDADGSNKIRLTTDPGFDGDPRWSPDGTQLLFTTDRTGDYEIFIMDADGSNQRNLTNHPADDEYPTWSPDGSVIAFHSSRHGGISLWVMNADGSDQSNLSWNAPVGYPSFAPEG